MAGEKISELAPAVSITGTELIPVATGGNNKSITPNQIAALATTDLVIGSDVQAHSAKLDALAAQTWAADSISYQTSSSAVAEATLTSFGRSLIDDANAAAARSTLGVVIGTDVQAYSAKLGALAAQTWAADSISYQTSTSAVAETTLTAFGRSLIDDADAATARSTLGLVIGTNVQAYDADLTTWAGLTPSANAQSLVTAADYAAMRSLLSLVVGTNVQAYHANLAAFAGLSLVADRLPYANGTGTLALATFTTFGRSLVDDADATAGRTTLGLGSLATLSTINGGNWSGTDLAVVDGGTGASTASAARTNLGFADGTYSPTLTNVANVDATTVGAFRYLQVGNSVTVSGTLAVDAAAAATFTQVGISLPVASNFTAVGDCCGTCVGDGGSNGSGVVRGDVTNDRAEMFFVPAGATNTTWYVHFTYTVQ